jgi:hypothetical protein
VDSRRTSADPRPACLRVNSALHPAENGPVERILGSMNDTDTAGRRLVKLLDEGLPSGIVWTAKERAVLTLIEQSADRIAVLKTLLDAEMAKPGVAAHRVCELAGEIRMSESSVAKLVSGLDPEMVVQAKSVRHQDAARARWNGVGVGGPA